MTEDCGQLFQNSWSSGRNQPVRPWGAAGHRPVELRRRVGVDLVAGQQRQVRFGDLVTQPAERAVEGVRGVGVVAGSDQCRERTADLDPLRQGPHPAGRAAVLLA
ncbi:hypothetical protein [Pseudonocardia sp. NPDC049635]|uniref:hypothetical protein n=1 Tax=Pseudonocardia sp. NPDC049635 TaxID=3155506 RepID=UPI0033EC6620